MFRRLKIRNGGQDFAQLSFRDGVNQQLLYEHLDIDLMGYRPAILYLNGAYWGIYGIREFYNSDYISAHYPAVNSPLDILYNPLGIPYKIKEGSADSYHALRTFIQDQDISQQDNYNHIKSKIDLQEYIDYHVAQIYLSNADWPDRNVTIWKEQNAGKWRWLMYDTDVTTNMGSGSASLASENSLRRSLNAIGYLKPYPAGTLFFRKLMENNDFKNEFIQRTCTYRTLVFNPDRVYTFVDEIQEKLLPEIPRHISKWRPPSTLGNGTPMGGHIDNWGKYIDNYKTFFVERQDFIFEHYQTTLGLDHTFSLSYNHNDTTHGKVYIHENDLPVPIGFQAEYFANIPIQIKAVADSMYTFSYWEETLDTNAITTFQSTTDTTLTPIFTRIQMDTLGTNEPDLDPINIDTMPPVMLPFSLNVYPNPMREQLAIYYNHPEIEPLSIEVINILGQSIADFTLEQTTTIIQQKNIDVNNWANGVYFLLVKKEPSLIFKILKK